MNLKVFHLKIVNSTNDYAIRKIKQGQRKGILGIIPSLFGKKHGKATRRAENREP